MPLSMRRAVFLDRDGVLNRGLVRAGKPYAPAVLEEFEILPGVKEALNDLREAGAMLIVVTNQPDVGNGTMQRSDVETMNHLLLNRLPLDEIRVCYHTDADECGCRKPRPGMLTDAAAAHNIDLSHSFMIGDRWRDIGAGQAAGCSTVFVDYGYDEARPEAPDHIVASLAEAVPLIVNEFRRKAGNQ